jgi:hypothetical protein
MPATPALQVSTVPSGHSQPHDEEHERAGARALPVQLGIAAAGGGTAYLRRSRPVPTYRLVSSRVNLACASMTVEIHSTSLCLTARSW